MDEICVYVNRMSKNRGYTYTLAVGEQTKKINNLPMGQSENKAQKQNY